MKRTGLNILAALTLLLMTGGIAGAQNGQPAVTPEDLAEGIEEAVLAGADLDPAQSAGGLPQFDPTWFASQIFWLVIAFGVLYVFFARRTLPTLAAITDSRKTHIQSNLDQAEQLSIEAGNVQAAYEYGLSGARTQAATMVADAQTAIQARKNEEADAFRLKTEQQVRETEARLDAAKAKAMSEISDIVAEVATEAVEKITGVSADAQQAKAIVNDLGTIKANAA